MSLVTKSIWLCDNMIYSDTYLFRQGNDAQVFLELKKMHEFKFLIDCMSEFWNHWFNPDNED